MRTNRAAIAAALAAAIAAASAGTACSPAGEQGETGEAAVDALHRDSIVVDTHSDTTPWFQDPEWDFAARHETGDMDLPRIREGGLDVQFWSIYLGRREGDGRAIREALERIDAVYEMIRRHPGQTELAKTEADIRRIVADGRIASLMGVEGGHIIEDNLAVLRTFQRLGVRYMTLTHSFHTGWADSSGTTKVPEPVHGGLTSFGEEIVREMNRLGMMVDVSHVSDDTFADTIRVSRAPVIASHSSCRAVADHPRNMTDDMLRALAKNGGVVMINFYPSYIDVEVGKRAREHYETIKDQMNEIRERAGGDLLLRMREGRKLNAAHPWPQAPLSTLLDHFDHAIAVAGADHVGLGADWDGVPSMPSGLDDVSKLPALTHGLIERGHSPETVRKVLGENLLRVMRENERVARELAGS
ncbi:MAG: dipeptidase [Deltaproteobacteria bacterium]|nr:dipeptidase [Deltaproteobacteria bacterium]